MRRWKTDEVQRMPKFIQFENGNYFREQQVAFAEMVHGNLPSVQQQEGHQFKAACRVHWSDAEDFLDDDAQD